jgi:nucleotide-binding universal stress UspA family protein
MTFLVPFDGSPLAETALRRAASFATVFDESVVAVSVIPEGNADYARERGWLDEGEPFDVQAIVDHLGDRVAQVAPDAEFRAERVGRDAPSGTISNRVRKAARQVGASMVFVGSENAGHVVTSLCTVGSGIATDADYDVVIVRNERPGPFEEGTW